MLDKKVLFWNTIVTECDNIQKGCLNTFVIIYEIVFFSYAYYKWLFYAIILCNNCSIWTKFKSKNSKVYNVNKNKREQWSMLSLIFFFSEFARYFYN